MKRSRVEKYYDKHARAYSSATFSPEDVKEELFFANKIAWHFLRKYVPSSRSSLILDAGSGNGDWAIQFAQLGYKNIVLTDISQAMLNEAKRRFAKLATEASPQFVKSDIVNMKEFPSNMFDFVFSQYDAVSYCLSPKAAIEELARVAKRGAFVSVTLDTKFSRVPKLIERGMIGAAWRLLKTNILHGFAFPSYDVTWEELAGYFESAGLQVVEVIGAPVFMHLVKTSTMNKLKAMPQIRNVLLKMELENCTNRSLVNMAGHLQMIGRKTAEL